MYRRIHWNHFLASVMDGATKEKLFKTKSSWPCTGCCVLFSAVLSQCEHRCTNELHARVQVFSLLEEVVPLSP